MTTPVNVQDDETGWKISAGESGRIDSVFWNVGLKYGF